MRFLSLKILLLCSVISRVKAFSQRSCPCGLGAKLWLNGDTEMAPNFSCRGIKIDEQKQQTHLFSSPPSIPTTGGKSVSDRSSWREKGGMVLWFLSLSYFIMRNYKVAPWIPWPSSFALNKRAWVLVHALSNMFFTGGIVLSTIFEFLIVSSAESSTTRNPEIIKYWFSENGVSKIDKFIVLPALTISIVAGFAQTAIDYGSMASAPKHIRRAIHILAAFAMWWMTTDSVTTQQKAQHDVFEWYEKVSDAGGSKTLQGQRCFDLPRVLYWRRFSNIVACLFVVALYALMTLKPGYSVS